MKTVFYFVTIISIAAMLTSTTTDLDLFVTGAIVTGVGATLLLFF